MAVRVERDLAPDIASALSRGIAEFNRATISDLEPNEAEVRFHVIATDEDENTIGGLRGACYWNTLHIELLWLADEARGSGVGRHIVKAAEQFALEHHCEKALVETTSWQAKPFYEKIGYELMATLEGRPRGHASHYLSKTLTGPTS